MILRLFTWIDWVKNMVDGKMIMIFKLFFKLYGRRGGFLYIFKLKVIVIEIMNILSNFLLI